MRKQKTAPLSDARTSRRMREGARSLYARPDGQNCGDLGDWEFTPSTSDYLDAEAIRKCADTVSSTQLNQLNRFIESFDEERIDSFGVRLKSYQESY